MFLVGLTGNIATGKSSVMQMLGALGAELIDADQEAHDVILPGGPGYLKVIEAFGHEVMQPGGDIDRKRLGEIVFKDGERLRVLEQIVHPLVAERVAARLQSATRPVVVLEAIKLFEAGLATLCNEVWVVTSPKELQLARLRETRGLSRAAAKMRIDAQPPQQEKIKRADVVLKNTGSLDELRSKVESEWARLQQKLPVQP
jgi:dephospho-CoA kinase